jgi:hypothetical protein
VQQWRWTDGEWFNPLTPNDPYSSPTAPLTSKRCILYIYSTNTGTEYFKHGVYSPFFFSSKCSLFHNSNLFGSCIIHILYTECAKIKKIIPAPKRLTSFTSLITVVTMQRQTSRFNPTIGDNGGLELWIGLPLRLLYRGSCCKDLISLLLHLFKLQRVPWQQNTVITRLTSDPANEFFG